MKVLQRFHICVTAGIRRLILCFRVFILILPVFFHYLFRDPDAVYRR